MKLESLVLLAVGLVRLGMGTATGAQRDAIQGRVTEKRVYDGEYVANEYQNDVDSFSDEEVFGTSYVSQ